MKYLYHYSNNLKGFSILKGKSIRLFDIRKSNDYKEILIFYPDIIESIYTEYKKTPFDFKYYNKSGNRAFRMLLDNVKTLLDLEIQKGELTSFVLCFSEEADMLSQWRGYADDGKGISIGFSIENLKTFCDKNSIFDLKKVEYITEEQKKKIISRVANGMVNIIRNLREDDVDNGFEGDPEWDSSFRYSVLRLIEEAMICSLIYKNKAFEEEKEWRLFISHKASKNPAWVTGNGKQSVIKEKFDETVSFLRNRIQFNICENDIKPYVSLDFNELGMDSVSQVWIGPKSEIGIDDIELFLRQQGYKGVEICFSKASYR